MEKYNPVSKMKADEIRNELKNLHGFDVDMKYTKVQFLRKQLTFCRRKEIKTYNEYLEEIKAEK